MGDRSPPPFISLGLSGLEWLIKARRTWSGFLAPPRPSLLLLQYRSGELDFYGAGRERKTGEKLVDRGVLELLISLFIK